MDKLPIYVNEEKDKFPKELIENPYRYIQETYERRYPYIGKKIYSFLSLCPISLVIPEVIISNNIKTNRTLSMLWLAPPASGKTKISERFEKISINPISSHRITPARLIHEIRKTQEDLISLIISDVAVSFSNDVFVKTVESIVEEGNVNWDTMREKDEEVGKGKIRAIAYLSGTPKLISDNRIRDGILGRVFPIISNLTKEQHKKLIRKMYTGDNDKTDIEDSIENINKYYKKILDMKDQIDGFIISDEIKNELGLFVEENKYLDYIFKKLAIPATRQLEDAFTILASSCFLNIFNRKIENNKLVVTKEDLEVTIKLVNRGAYYSYSIYDAIERVDWHRVKNERELRNYLTRTKIEIPKSTKFIMEGIVSGK